MANVVSIFSRYSPLIVSEENRDSFVRNRIKDLTISHASQTSASVELQSLLILPFPSLVIFKSDEFVDGQSCNTIFQTIERSHMAGTLRQIYLSAHPGALTLPGECGTIKCLEILSLVMCRADPVDNNSVVMADFLLSVSATLKALQISNCGTMVALAPLFTALSAHPGKFRRLRTISLADDTLDISAFHDFLSPYCRKLEQLELAISDEGLTEGWLDWVVNGQSMFPSLRAFKICPPTTPSGLPLLTTLIKGISSTLSRLQFQGPLHHEALMQVFGGLSGSAPSGLRILVVEIHTLTIPFLDLLSSNIHQLEKLELWVTEVEPSDEVNMYCCLRYFSAELRM
jgi:hypothetical protein